MLISNFFQLEIEFDYEEHLRTHFDHVSEFEVNKKWE